MSSLRVPALRALAFVAPALVVAGCHDPAPAAPPDAGGWSAIAPLPVPRFEAKAVVLRGKVLYVGGITGVTGDQASARESDRVDVYDPATGAWSAGPPLPPDAPKHHLAITVLDDRVYVLGGFTGIIGGADAAGVFTPSAATFVLESGAWRRLADQPVARGSATAEAIGGMIYVAGGGVAEPDARTDNFAYDPAHDTWSERAPVPTAREHVASCVIDGAMIVLGGWAGDDKHVVGAAESYDPARDVWTRLPDMPTPRGGLGAVAVDGACVAVGGEDWVSPLPGTSAAVESLDVARGAWTALPPLGVARHGLGVATLDGVLYAVGGGPVRGNSYTDRVETLRP